MKTNSEPAGPQGQRKVFDVMRPGKTPPSATSRPVITGHQSKVQDDVVGGISPRIISDPADEQHPLMDSRNRVTVQPAGALNKDIEVMGLDSVTTPDTRSEDIEEPDVPDASEHPQPDAIEATAPDSRPESQPLPRQDALLAEAAKDLDNIADDASVAPPPERMVISHHKPGFNGGRFLIVLLVIALLGLLVLNLLLDMGILNAESPLPHTDFFKE